MTLGIIVVTHGKSGAELVKSAEMIVGQQNSTETIEFLSTDSVDSLSENFNKALNNLSGSQNILALVDIQGGSPFNVATQYSDKLIDILCGVNIPILIELFLNRDNEEIENLLTNSINVGKNSIIKYSDLSIIQEDEEF